MTRDELLRYEQEAEQAWREAQRKREEFLDAEYLAANSFDCHGNESPDLCSRADEARSEWILSEIDWLDSLLTIRKIMRQQVIER